MQQNYLLIELLMSILATYFAEKIKFLLIFFQIYNLGPWYTSLFCNKPENILFDNTNSTTRPMP